MNCRDAESQIFAARDAELGAADAAVLEQHLAECPHCRRLAEGLETASQSWRERDTRVAMPNPVQEWHAVRRRIRQAEKSPSRTTGLPSWNHLLRLAVPLAAVFAIVIGITNRIQPPAVPTVTEPVVAQVDWSHFEEHFVLAHAEYVETENEDVSPFVYLDEESGWLIVWATDPIEHPSI